MKKEDRKSKVFTEEISSEEKLIETIIAAEWKQFDQVKNEGGRADCQDDWHTFYIMRKSQFLAWDHPTQKSWLNDLRRAGQQQRNLIMEKYARMMESTAPARYEMLRPYLPVHSPERICLQEDLISLHICWMETFSASCPKMAGNSRSIRTCTDTPQNTSYETYLRGELGTYSDHTLNCYRRHVQSLQEQNINLITRIMNYTARFYGYQNAKDAEARL